VELVRWVVLGFLYHVFRTFGVVIAFMGVVFPKLMIMRIIFEMN